MSYEERQARREKVLALARKQLPLREGELELDDGDQISEGSDNGAYVQVWAWVSFEGTELDKDENR